MEKIAKIQMTLITILFIGTIGLFMMAPLQSIYTFILFLFSPLIFTIGPKEEWTEEKKRKMLLCSKLKLRFVPEDKREELIKELGTKEEIEELCFHKPWVRIIKRDYKVINTVSRILIILLMLSMVMALSHSYFISHILNIHIIIGPLGLPIIGLCFAFIEEMILEEHIILQIFQRDYREILDSGF